MTSDILLASLRDGEYAYSKLKMVLFIKLNVFYVILFKNYFKDISCVFVLNGEIFQILTG